MRTQARTLRPQRRRDREGHVPELAPRVRRKDRVDRETVARVARLEPPERPLGRHARRAPRRDIAGRSLVTGDRIDAHDSSHRPDEQLPAPNPHTPLATAVTIA